jgi:predicted transcriptional regulator
MQTLSLNQNELEALRILWELGESKPSDIQSHFSWPIENATLRSVLMNLVEKKHAVRRPEGKAYLYAAQAPKAAMLQNFARHLARVFAGGSCSELVAQLVETSDIKPSDLELLRQKAAKKIQSTKRKPK